MSLRATIVAALADLARDVRNAAADLRADIVREIRLIVWHWQLQRRNG